MRTLTQGVILAFAAVTPLSGQAQDAETAAVPEVLPGTAEPAAAAGAEPAAPPEAYQTIPVASTPAAAPGAAAPAARTGLSIEEVVVTAQKREENINDVPIAINAFTSDTLDALGVTDTTNLSNIVPGFTFANSGYNTPVYTLRGIGFNDQTYSASSTVGIYVDEVNLPNSIMSKGANLDIQRVEVLKGPQGILYGRNTTGGLVNYISNKPTETFDAGFKGSYSSFQTIDMEGFLSGPISDTLRYRLAAHEIHSGEGWQKSITRPGDRLGKVNKQSARATLDWTPSDNLLVELIGSYWGDHSDSQTPQVIAIHPQNPLPVLQQVTLDPRVRNHPLVPQHGADPQAADWDPNRSWELHDRFFQGATKIKWNLSEATDLTVIGAYNRVESNGSNIANTGLSVPNIDQTLFAFIANGSLEARLAGTFGNDSHWQFGGNYSQYKSEEYHVFDVNTVSVVFPIPIPLSDRLPAALGNLAGPVVEALDQLLPNVSINDLNSIGAVQDQATSLGKFKGSQSAVFANFDWRFTETLRLSAGARYTLDNQEAYSCAVDGTAGQKPESNPNDIGFGPVLTALNLVLHGAVQTPPGRGQCFPADAQGKQGPYTGNLDENNISARMALDWKPAEHLLFYTSLARGFKSGAFPVVTSTVKESYGPAKQEELRAAEIGAKTAFFNRNLSINAAGFYYDYRDKQLLTRLKDPIFGPLPVIKNAPKSRVYGAELDMQATPLRGLYLSLAGSYIKSEIIEFVSTNIDGDQQDFAGFPFNFTPEWQGTALFDYTLPVLTEYAIGFGADYSYTGKTNSRLERSPISEHFAYGLVGARIHAMSPSGRWNFSIWGRNLTDELQTISIISAGDSVPRFVGMTRTIGASLTYRFAQ